MLNNYKYIQMKLKNIDRFIKVSKESGYSNRNVGVSGR